MAGDEVLWRAFGKHGKSMRERARGIDDRPVEPDREEKSISAEETYATDIRGAAELDGAIAASGGSGGIAAAGARSSAAGTVNVKIRRADFTTYTRQRALEPPTQDTAVVSAAAKTLLEEWLAAQPNAAVRLLGVGVSDLQLLQQGDLFSRRACPGIAAGLGHRRDPRPLRVRDADPRQPAAAQPQRLRTRAAELVS